MNTAIITDSVKSIVKFYKVKHLIRVMRITLLDAVGIYNVLFTEPGPGAAQRSSYQEELNEVMDKFNSGELDFEDLFYKFDFFADDTKSGTLYAEGALYAAASELFLAMANQKNRKVFLGSAKRFFEEISSSILLSRMDDKATEEFHLKMLLQVVTIN
jgi:hypothetical protein